MRIKERRKRVMVTMRRRLLRFLHCHRGIGLVRGKELGL